jgi:hypothetical protein
MNVRWRKVLLLSVTAFALCLTSPARGALLQIDFAALSGEAQGWDAIPSFVQNGMVRLRDWSGGGDDDVTLTVLDADFSPNNPAPPGVVNSYDGILVPPEANDDYLFRVPDTAGTSARLKIEHLNPGVYNVTVFEGRQTDGNGQFAVIWAGDNVGSGEPAAQNTGNFAAGASTVRVNLDAGDILWYRHLEDNTGGISGMIVRPLAPAGSYAAEVLRDNPVAYWRLGEASLNDPMVDLAGNVANGQYEDGGRTGLQPGFQGAIIGDSDTAVRFQSTFGFACGDCGQGQVPVGGPLDLGTVDSTQPITLEAWFKLLPSVNEALPPSAFPRIFHYNNEADGQYAFGVVGNDNAGFPAARSVWAARGDGGGSGVVILAGPTDAVEPTDEEVWHHLAAHLERDSVRLFLDGQELTDLTDSDPIAWQAIQATIGGRLQSDEVSFVQGFPGLIDELAIYDTLLSPARIQAHYLVGSQGGAKPLQAGDADQDLDFDQLDLVRVQIAAKYLTGRAATWGEGDWNGAPGGSPGSPPAGDGFFNQIDIIAALGNGLYLTGPYAALRPSGSPGDGQTSIVYNASTGQLAVDAPAAVQLTSVNIDSAAGIFTGDAAQNLGGSFDNDSDANIFKATFGSSFGSISFGNVAQPGLSEQFVLGDLTVVGSLAGGGALGNVDLIYVPEPSALVLSTMALVGLVGVLLGRSRLPDGT